MRTLLAAVFAALLVASGAAASNICATNGTIYAHVLNVLNLTHPALAPVAAAAARGDANGACEALAMYYITSGTASWWRAAAPPPSERLAGGSVDAMVFHDIFALGGVGGEAKIPRNADGGLDWVDHGPNSDPEFMNVLNRHQSFGDLLAAWLSTGNGVYSAYFSDLVVDWALHNPCPGANEPARVAACVPQNSTGTPCSWRAPGEQRCTTGTAESPWRSLEMGIRMAQAWPQAFFGFQAAANFSTSARVLLLLAVGEHFAALAVDGGHPGRGTPNWEM